MSDQRALPLIRQQADVPIVMRLRLEPGEPITGTLNSETDEATIRFCGWMELIAAIADSRPDSVS
jgi:hypothetical protein